MNRSKTQRQIFLLVSGRDVGAHLDCKTAGAHELLKTVRIFAYRK